MQGVSLLEIVMVVAILVVALLIYLPSIDKIKNINDLTVTVDAVLSSFKRAQVKAVSNQNDSVWGTKIEANKVTIFRGSSFSGRNPSFDETFQLPSQVFVSGPSEIFFSKLAGLPNATGSMTLSTVGGSSKIININEQGVLDN